MGETLLTFGASSPMLGDQVGVAPNAMRIVFATDIHSDHALKRCPHKTMDDLVGELLLGHPHELPVVITGDLAISPMLQGCLSAFGRTGRDIHFVLGNHDFWAGSFAGTRKSILPILEEFPNLHYPTLQGPRVQGGWTVLGHDGWYDFGFVGAAGFMNCRHSIEDFLETAWNADMYIRQLQKLGAESARAVQDQLNSLDPGATKILVLTHVPPWRDLTMRNDLPQFYCNRHMGVFLEDWAKAHPEQQLTVLCGHSHMGLGEFVRKAPNLRAMCGQAVYEFPRALEIDLSLL